MKILVVVPHADDEAICMGGTIAKLSKMNRVEVAICAVGYGSTELRLMELKASIEILGCQHTILDYENESFLDAMPQDQLVSQIDTVLRLDYDQVYYPCPGQHHQDHRAVHEACQAALRNSKSSLLAMYEYAYPGWTEFSQPIGKLYVDITNTIETKLKAVACYQSQLHGQVSLNNVRRLASARGLEAGCDYAEMFYIAKELR